MLSFSVCVQLWGNMSQTYFTDLLWIPKRFSIELYKLFLKIHAFYYSVIKKDSSAEVFLKQKMKISSTIPILFFYGSPTVWAWLQTQKEGILFIFHVVHETSTVTELDLKWCQWYGLQVTRPLLDASKKISRNEGQSWERKQRPCIAEKRKDKA